MLGSINTTKNHLLISIYNNGRKRTHLPAQPNVGPLADRLGNKRACSLARARGAVQTKFYRKLVFTIGLTIVACGPTKVSSSASDSPELAVTPPSPNSGPNASGGWSGTTNLGYSNPNAISYSVDIASLVKLGEECVAGADGASYCGTFTAAGCPTSLSATGSLNIACEGAPLSIGTPNCKNIDGALMCEASCTDVTMTWADGSNTLACSSGQTASTDVNSTIAYIKSYYLECRYMMEGRQWTPSYRSPSYLSHAPYPPGIGAPFCDLCQEICNVDPDDPAAGICTLTAPSCLKLCNELQCVPRPPPGVICSGEIDAGPRGIFPCTPPRLGY